MYLSPTTLWRVTLIFMLFWYFQQEVRFWLIHYWEHDLCFKGCLIHIDLQDVLHVDSLILSNTFPCSFHFVFWLATLAFIFPVFN